MKFIRNLFDRKVYFYRGLILTPEKAQIIKSNGIDVPLYNGANREHLVESIKYFMEAKNHPIDFELDIDKNGFRQVPPVIGQIAAGTYIGIYMGSTFREAARYALGLIGKPHDVGHYDRGYVFCIEMKESEIFVGDSEDPYVTIPNSYFAFMHSRKNSHAFYLDTHIPAKRIVNVVDLGPVRDLSVSSAQRLLEDAASKYGK